MAATITIEEESGVCSGRLHPHNGYYAGDFSSGSSAPRADTQLHLISPWPHRSAKSPADLT